jgi:hypothetical protein
LLAAGSALLSAACSDSSAPGNGQSPALPSVNSMKADLSLFDQAGASNANAAVVGSNFFAAALAVSVANAATTLVMAVPVATFAAAASQTPVFEDGAFHWRYSTTVNGQAFQADLSGEGSGTQSLWAMHITASGTVPPLDDFLYYDGTAQLSGESGTWHIYDASQPSANRELLRIDWTHTGTTAWHVAFTNVTQGSPDIGDQLAYDVNGEARSVSFRDASAVTTTEVLWNASTHAGSIVAPSFNGGVKACWDTQFQNVACP